jgi:hypothetical protein
MDVSLDTTELLKWARYMNRVPRRTGAAIARALNTVGDNILHEAAHAVAQETGLDPNDVFDLIGVKKATPDDLNWSMDTSKVFQSEQMDWSRPWDKRTGFDDRTLLKVITRDDGTVCDKCIEVAAHSPYTLEELMGMNPYNNGLVHPNCHCWTETWHATRQMPVTFGKGAPVQLFTMKQLGDAVAKELKTTLTARDFKKEEE